MKIPTWKILGLAQPLRVKVNGRSVHTCRLHRIWDNMCMRTSDCPSWKKGRHAKYYEGVTMCDEWRCSFAVFWFWAWLNGYRDDLTIDRIDGRKGYCPENCRWAEAFRVAARRNVAKANRVRRTSQALRGFDL